MKSNEVANATTGNAFEVGKEVIVTAMNEEHCGPHGFTIGEIVVIIDRLSGNTFKARRKEGDTPWNNCLYISEIHPVKTSPFKYALGDTVVIRDETNHAEFENGEQVAIVAYGSEVDKEYKACRLDNYTISYVVYEDELHELTDDELFDGISDGHAITNTNEEEASMTNGKMKMDDSVKMLVVIDGYSHGIVGGTTDLEALLERIGSDIEISEEWVEENVELYPVLSTDHIGVQVEIQNDYDVSIDDEDLMDEEYIVEVDGRRKYEFGSEDALQDFIREGLNDGDFTEDDVNNEWEISKVMTERVTVEVEREELEVSVLNTFERVSEYVQAPEVDYDSMSVGQLNNLIMQLTVLRDDKVGN